MLYSTPSKPSQALSFLFDTNILHRHESPPFSQYLIVNNFVYHCVYIYFIFLPL